ncbi:uncharacterized protein HGUI_02060 [Hanseniaspora guilliermondii]|uniref:RRM domain-containing protein n=1 Tax=Hanseniaspora guilliermondii TaxID=56406 RepID=A0A1L0B212_9ASCO|nr:uncharacterized protein HGUI_02060 [Hanseniaspora guilliermondii]
MNTNSRAPRNNNRRTVRGSNGKSISFQKAGRRRSPAVGSKLSSSHNNKAEILHQLKVSKLTAQSIAENHKNQVLKYSNQQAAIISKKVSVAGLPADVNEKSIKEFFNSAVGGVRNIELFYNQYGKSTGNCMITFVTFEQAAALVKNYNGAPIDNGKSKLKLSLVVDTSRNTQPAALAARIGIPNTIPKNGSPKDIKKKVKALATKAKPAKKPVKKTKATKKPAPVSLEDLDKQMSDYFAPPTPAGN